MNGRGSFHQVRLQRWRVLNSFNIHLLSSHPVSPLLIQGVGYSCEHSREDLPLESLHPRAWTIRWGIWWPMPINCPLTILQVFCLFNWLKIFKRKSQVILLHYLSYCLTHCQAHYRHFINIWQLMNQVMKKVADNAENIWDRTRDRHRKEVGKKVHRKLVTVAPLGWALVLKAWMYNLKRKLRK